MTLCLAWKGERTVHFASDSRLTFGDTYADVGVKVLSIPYRIYEAGSAQPPRVAFNGELGMCFAGSAVSSLTIKESVVEILRSLQYAPGHTDISMEGIAKYIFKAYRQISRHVCETTLLEKGRADIIIGGRCPEKKILRVFLLSTDGRNRHCVTEIMKGSKDHCFLGSGAKRAERDLPQAPSDIDYFNILKSVIDDKSIASVGGNIQYGAFRGDSFTVYGVYELGEQVHYWRAALDLNSDEFIGDSANVIPAFQYIDPFATVGV